jgi:NAD-dependent dihydropyrimidine dehydrogenase PreA subunit
VSQSPDVGSLLREHVQLALELRRLEIFFDPARCQGVWECYEVCPVGCWKPDYDRGVVAYQYAQRCIACNACVLQCPEGAIELKVPDG